MTLELGKPNTAEVEHIIPVSADGLTNQFNLMASGADCNRFKADKPLNSVFTELRKLKLCKEG